VRAFADMPGGRIYSDWSSVVSATTQAALPAPGAVTDFSLTDNGDGTGDLDWTLPDEYASSASLEIWSDSSTAWVALQAVDPEAESAAGVEIPGSSGATPNANGEYGLRLKRTNATGSSWSNEQWVPITDSSGSSLTAGVLGPVVTVSSSALRIPL